MMSYVHKLKYIYMGLSNKVPEEIAMDFAMHSAGVTYGIGPIGAKKLKPRMLAFMNVANMAQNQAFEEKQLGGKMNADMQMS